MPIVRVSQFKNACLAEHYFSHAHGRKRRIFSSLGVRLSKNWVGAYSDNVFRSYRSDFASFEAWCRNRLRSDGALPVAIGRVLRL